MFPAFVRRSVIDWLPNWNLDTNFEFRNIKSEEIHFWVFDNLLFLAVQDLYRSRKLWLAKKIIIWKFVGIKEKYTFYTNCFSCTKNCRFIVSLGSKQYSASIAFTLALFSHLVNHVNIRLQAELEEAESQVPPLHTDTTGEKGKPCPHMERRKFPQLWLEVSSERIPISQHITGNLPACVSYIDQCANPNLSSSASSFRIKVLLSGLKSFGRTKAVCEVSTLLQCIYPLTSWLLGITQWRTLYLLCEISF